MKFETQYRTEDGIFSGERLECISWSDAEYQASLKGLEIVGELIAEIPCDENFVADWSRRIDYDVIANN